jgi:hypothetical protein
MIEQNTPRRKTHVLVIMAALVIIVMGINQAQSVLVLLQIGRAHV